MRIFESQTLNKWHLTLENSMHMRTSELFKVACEEGAGSIKLLKSSVESA